VRLACALWAFLGIAGPGIFLSQPANANPAASRAGFIDLSRRDFARDGSQSLAGEWLYFDGRWLTGNENVTGGVATHAPGTWPAVAADGTTKRFGYGTYLLKLRLPKSPDEPLSLDTGQFLSAYRIYANGRLIAHGGVPGETAETERANAYSALAVLPAQSDVTLAIQVSNHVNGVGGVFVAPTVGLVSAIEAQRQWTVMVALIVVGALFFAACYHFAFNRVTRGGNANLWFGLVAALLTARNFLIDPLARYVVPYLGQDWVWRWDFATTELSLACAYWFFALSFRRHLSWSVGVAVSIACVACTLLGIVGGPGLGDDGLKVIEVVGLATVLYGALATARAAWDGEKGAGLALLGVILVASSMLHDTLVDNHLITGVNFLPFGAIAFFLCLSGALTSRSHHAFASVENLSTELKGHNTKLETLVTLRTSQLKEKIQELEANQIALEQSRIAAVMASETKSRFLANMSHELRTPLNAILGFSEVIHARLYGDAVERYVEYGGHIHKSGRHLLDLITDILDLSKIEAGKLELQDERFDLNAEIRSALTLLERQAAAKSVRLIFPPSSEFRILADKRALRQIIVNLLSNAVKFTLEGGEVAICVRGEENGSLVMEVKDNGVGIKPEDMSRVMESFGQARHDIAATEDRGTGLGLPIVKGLVEAHGGTLGIASNVGVGTCVTVTLPAERVLETLSDAA
jgi:signal transduction histidine kinase